ncbi:hypothetical protein [Thalassotalea atypica]|uniref:hypothetical protein n=1 Tax=Thalassotalea atypica TaxID=2054316 RepID=UPI002572A725|nr:hypothetical protein [Thalassotalea atypica]
MELQIKAWISSIIFLVVGVIIGSQLRFETTNNNLVVPYIVQPECETVLSDILSKQAQMYNASSVLDFSPDIKKVIIFTGTEAQYERWINLANEKSNSCNRNVFTSFDIKQHLSSELQETLSKSRAKNIFIDGERINVYFSDGAR